MKTQIKAGEMVTVYGKPGIVRYVTADGWFGVAILNENGRVDEWQPCQVEPATPEAAGRLAAALMAR